MNTPDISSLTIDSLFDPDDSRNSASELSRASIIRPQHYQYGLYLEIMNHEVRKGIVNICRLSKAVSRLFSSYPDIETCSEPTFHTQHVDRPFRQTFTYPFDNIPEYITGHLLIRFDAHFRDAYALCRFLAKLSNAINHLNAAFIWVEYKTDSDEEKWRYNVDMYNTLNYIRKSFQHSEIHVNTTGPERTYISVYQKLNILCDYLFKDKLQTYRRLKRVFDNTESPTYYQNIRTCAANLIHVHDFQVSELFTSGLEPLKQAEIDFSNKSLFDTYNISFSLSPIVDTVKDVESWAAYSEKIQYIIDAMTNHTMKGHITDIHVFHDDETYILSGLVGTFINNDYERTPSYLIISISGTVRRKSCSFAKNLNSIFRKDCEAAINQYIRWLHHKK